MSHAATCSGSFGLPGVGCFCPRVRTGRPDLLSSSILECLGFSSRSPTLRSPILYSPVHHNLGYEVGLDRGYLAVH